MTRGTEYICVTVKYICVTVMGVLLAGGLGACGEAETNPAPQSQAPGAQEQADDEVDEQDGVDQTCESISQTIMITEQSDLAQFADLECFDVEGHVFVQGSEDIDDLDELSGLRSTTGYVGIADNEALESVSLDSLETTGEGLVVEGNTVLTEIDFPALSRVDHYLHVFNNPALGSAGFEQLIEVGDEVIFAGVDTMTNLQLPQLTSVEGNFIYQHSDGLECLCLPELVFVGGDFAVHFNGAIRSLAAPVLDTVTGDLELRRNPRLEHIDLDAVDDVQGDVIVANNHLLAECSVDQWVDQISAIGGDALVSDNSQTCPEEPVSAEDVGCVSCVPGEEPGDDDDDEVPGDDDDDDELPGDDDDDDELPGDDDDDDELPVDDDDDDELPVDDDDDDDDGELPVDDDDDDDIPTDLAIEALSLEDNPNNTLSTFLDVETSQPAFVTVSAESGEHDFELVFDEQERTEHSLTLIGFRADRTYQLEVRAHTESGAEVTEEIEFTSGSLPADFAPLDVAVSQPEQMEPGITLFNLTRWTPVIDNSWAYIVGIDESGEVVWYYEPENRAQDTILLQNGNIAFNTSQSNIVEITLAGEVVNRWSADELDVDYFHHEVFEMPNGNLVTLGSELRSIGGFGEAGDTTHDVVGDVVVEFTRDGQVVHEHSMFETLDPHRWGVGGFHGGYWNDRYADRAPQGTKDWTHGNAVYYDSSDDAFLVSLRHQDWVIKIDRQTGDLIWRFGAEGDFELTEGEWFYHQHDPEIVDGGNILLYDNGNLRPGFGPDEVYSRAVEYDLDEGGADPGSASQGVARQVWEFRDDEPFYSDFVSGVEKQANGNVLIADGARQLDQTLPADDPNNLLFSRIVEVTGDDDAEKVFEVIIRDQSGEFGYTMYRASRVDLLGDAPSQ